MTHGLLRLHTRSRQGEAGQIALIVLLLMAVVLTVGLSIASRTVMDVSLSRQEEEGSMTFQAAESGIENALNQDFSSIVTPTTLPHLAVGNADVVASVTPQNRVETRVDEGGSVQINLTGAVDANTLTVNWGKNVSCPNIASLLVRVYNKVGNVYTARNYPISPCAASGFRTVTAGIGLGSNGYTKSYAVDLKNNDVAASIQVLGEDTSIAVNGGGYTLPIQNYTVRSQASNTQGSETRVIVVTRTTAGHPGILDYTLYSGSVLNQ